MTKIRAFTLAEVLITLTIIGAVAAMTIPQLVKNMNDYAYGKSKDTFDMKITEAMNQMKTNNVMDGYANNEKFVDVFQKYMKISKRCTASNLTDCFPAKIYATDGKEVDTAAKLKTGKDFGKSTYTAALSAVQFTNGTSALIAYDPACVAADPFNNQASATTCLSILYDVNGYSKPNKAGKDIKMFNVDQLGTAVAFTIGGVDFGAPFFADPITLADCNANKAALGISACSPAWDVWAGAVKACGGKSKLISEAQLDLLANAIYSVSNCGPSTCNGTFSPSISASYGLPSAASFIVWSSTEAGATGAYNRYFTPTYSARNYSNRSDWFTGPTAICVLN